MGKPITAPGTHVRLTGKFLRSTGQSVGSDSKRRWIVQHCTCSLCKDGRFVRTDEPKSAESLKMFTAEELEAEPALRARHFATCNLEKA